MNIRWDEKSLRVRVSEAEYRELGIKRELKIKPWGPQFRVAFEIILVSAEEPLKLMIESELWKLELSEKAYASASHPKTPVNTVGLPEIIFEVDLFSKQKRESREKANRPSSVSGA